MVLLVGLSFIQNGPILENVLIPTIDLPRYECRTIFGIVGIWYPSFEQMSHSSNVGVCPPIERLQSKIEIVVVCSYEYIIISQPCAIPY